MKQFEETFDVTAAAPVAVAAAPAGGGAAAVPGRREQDEFDVVLEAAGDKKIQVIKEVRALTSLGLKEAKDLVDGAPKPMLEKANKEAADKAKAQLEGEGATSPSSVLRLDPRAGSGRDRGRGRRRGVAGPQPSAPIGSDSVAPPPVDSPCSTAWYGACRHGPGRRACSGPGTTRGAVLDAVRHHGTLTWATYRLGALGRERAASG